MPSQRVPPLTVQVPQRESKGGKKKVNVDELTSEEKEKRRSKRARWGARNLLHESYSDGFPSLGTRFARERQAAEQKFEYNLGTRTFNSIEEAEDGMAWLRALFVELDSVVHAPSTDEKSESLTSIREFLEEELQFWRIQPSARNSRSNSNSPPPPHHKLNECASTQSSLSPATTPTHNTTPVFTTTTHQQGSSLSSSSPPPPSQCCGPTNVSAISALPPQNQQEQILETHSFHFNEPGPLGMDLKPCEFGIKILRIKPGSPADIVGLKPNDIITAINELHAEQIRTTPKEESMNFFSIRPLYVSVARILLSQSDTVTITTSSASLEDSKPVSKPKRARILGVSRGRPTPISTHSTAPPRFLSAILASNFAAEYRNGINTNEDQGDGITEPLSARSVETTDASAFLPRRNTNNNNSMPYSPLSAPPACNRSPQARGRGLH